ncbi:hypothetical protein [Streptomyces sp. NPDC054975]
MATPEREPTEARTRMSMSELLASCAAAEAVSTPPRATEPAPESESDAGETGHTIEREAA